MSIEMIIITALIVIIIIQLLCAYGYDQSDRRRLKMITALATEANETLKRERDAWTAERQQLLDRIQAPSFAEYKQAEVKAIKAQQGIKEPPPLEVL